MSSRSTSRLARLGPLLRQAHLRTTRAFNDVLRPLSIDGRHYGVLLHLELFGPMSQRRLVDLSGEDKSAMVRTVDDLERLGLAERQPDPADRRAYAVQITDRGRAVRADAAARTETALPEMFDALTTQDCDTLVALLEKLTGPSAEPGTRSSPHTPPSRSSPPRSGRTHPRDDR